MDQNSQYLKLFSRRTIDWFSGAQSLIEVFESGSKFLIKSSELEFGDVDWLEGEFVEIASTKNFWAETGRTFLEVEGGTSTYVKTKEALFAQVLRNISLSGPFMVDRENAFHMPLESQGFSGIASAVGAAPDVHVLLNGLPVYLLNSIESDFIACVGTTDVSPIFEMLARFEIVEELDIDTYSLRYELLRTLDGKYLIRTSRSHSGEISYRKIEDSIDSHALNIWVDHFEETMLNFGSGEYPHEFKEIGESDLGRLSWLVENFPSGGKISFDETNPFRRFAYVNYVNQIPGD